MVTKDLRTWWLELPVEIKKAIMKIDDEEGLQYGMPLPKWMPIAIQELDAMNEDPIFDAIDAMHASWKERPRPGLWWNE